MFNNIKNQLDSYNVREIMRACVYESTPDTLDNTIAEYRSRANWSLYGWIENGEIMGVCGFKVCHDELTEILHIAVTEKARGRGIGSAMVFALQNLFRLPVKAETDDDAVDFYRKLAFETSEFEKHGVRRYVCMLDEILISTPIEALEPSEDVCITR